MNTILSPWLTPEQAAAYLHVKPHTLAIWRARKTGPRFYKNAGVIRYLTADLDAYLGLAATA